MTDADWLAQRFETHRPHLRAVAYRMLGSFTEADDAVQDAWLRLSRSDTSDVENLGGWLTTVVARLCLDMLRSRNARREDPMGVHLPDPVVSIASDGASAENDPEHEAFLADSVGLAMLVVLETLSPAERLAFVLHDTFGMPFEQIGPIVGRSPVAARQLASRARRRVRTAPTSAHVPLARQHEVVDAFLAAARAGDFAELLGVLDPDVVVRTDAGALRERVATAVHGSRAVAEQALNFRALAGGARRAVVNGAAGLLVYADDRLFAVLGMTIRGDRIAEIDILLDPERLARLDLPAVKS
jgi:RNA polymerase sigma-70 factor (ECF subfamily)